MPSQAPSVVVADNTPGPAFRVPIVCKGHRASLYIEGSGDVVYEPQELSPTALDFDCNCLRSNAERKVFLKHDVVGATLEGEGQVRIWYCSPSHTTRGGHTKTRYSLQKSDRFEFPERQAAQRFVQETQAAVSWWGRKQPPRVVAIVNPVSGRGSGASIFSRQVLPVLRDAAGLVLEVHTTRHRGHATEIVARLDLQQVDLILYVGGDGTVFEGMQGLFSRPDWAAASRVPFAPVPTGSGNGLAASVGVFDALSAAFSVCKGRCQPLDVASVLQGANRYYLLLSLTYGLMANLDIGTEHLRWMGEPRFTIGGLQEILAARTYPLRVAVWPEETPPPPLSPPHPPHPPFLPPSPHAAHGGLGPPPDTGGQGGQSGQGRGEQQGGRGERWGRGGEGERVGLLPRGSGSGSLPSSSPTKARNMLQPHQPPPQPHQPPGGSHQAQAGQPALTPTAGQEEGCSPAAAVPSGCSPSQSGGVSSSRSLAEGGQQGLAGCFEGGGGGGGRGGLPLPILSQLGERLPLHVPDSSGDLWPGWQLLPDKVGAEAMYFMLHNTQYIALNARLNPQGRLADGLWDLITVSGLKGWSGTASAIELLLKSETGDHVSLDFVRTQRVRALMLEQLPGSASWTVLDGESVPNQPLFLEVHRQAATILTAPDWVDI